MTQIITRFAPSPTGYLHIGNARTALINWLYARKHNGQFILRFDDTDLERSKKEYKDAILKDLAWLGLDFDLTFDQSSRLDKYEAIKDILLKKGRLYHCFETQEELEMKRKLQLSSGHPPIYDRSALKLSKEEIQDCINQGKKPHYRFFIDNEEIFWQDMVKGQIHYEGSNLGDPVVIREDGTMTYMLCSTIDDIDYSVTHIVRGEDHVSNTAIQIQMFKALGAKVPIFGHLSLVKAQEEKISKRLGGFEIGSLRDEVGLEPMSINSFFSLIGSSKAVVPISNLSDLVEQFNIDTFSKSPTTYIPEELERLNHKLLIHLSFEEIKDRLQEFGFDMIDEKFWLAVRPNLQKLSEVKDWWKICHDPEKISGLDATYLNQAATVLPNEDIDFDTWGKWTNAISEITGKTGKELYMPLRLALTGMNHGPELKNILPLMSRKEIIARLIRS